MENNLTYLEEVKTTLEYQLHIAEQQISDFARRVKGKRSANKREGIKTD